jgi:hypothetical protein
MIQIDGTQLEKNQEDAAAECVMGHVQSWRFGLDMFQLRTRHVKAPSLSDSLIYFQHRNCNLLGNTGKENSVL